MQAAHGAGMDVPSGTGLAAGDAARNAAYVAGMHAALALWLFGASPLLPTALFVAATPLVCVVHQRFLSEWFHEATHWNFVPDRRWNDRLANLLMGLWIGTSIENHRIDHFRHHARRDFFRPDDPETAEGIAESRRELVRGLLLDLCGVSAVRKFWRVASRGSSGAGGGSSAAGGRSWLALVALVHGVGFTATLALGHPAVYPLYYGTLLTLYPVVNRIRLYGQHAGIRPDGKGFLVGSEVSRTIHAGRLEQLLLNCPVIMYHHEHHLRPQLPYRALRATAAPAGDPNASHSSCFRVFLAVWRGLPR